MNYVDLFTKLWNAHFNANCAILHIKQKHILTFVTGKTVSNKGHSDGAKPGGGDKSRGDLSFM